MTCFRRAIRTLQIVALFTLPLLAAHGGEPRTTEETSETRGPPVKGQAISISTEKATYAPEEPIVLRVRFENVWQEDVRVVHRHPLDVYQLKALFADGKEVPWTLRGKRDLDASTLGSRSMADLRPGEAETVELKLSRLLDFSLDGKYIISARRLVWEGGVPGSYPVEVTSNTLHITVDEKLNPGTFQWHWPQR